MVELERLRLPPFHSYESKPYWKPYPKIFNQAVLLIAGGNFGIRLSILRFVVLATLF